MRKVGLSLLLFCFSLSSWGQESGNLDFPLFDSPFNFSNGPYTFPSMTQAVKISNDFYHAVHFELASAWGPERELAGRFSILGFDLLTEWTPLGSSWVHEEWHRAVMSHRQISSYDDVNNFPFFQSSISVSHVLDVDLIRLKNDFPADLVRLEEAGFEAQDEQNLELEKESFFYLTRDFDYFILWNNYLNNTFYLYTCSTPEADHETDQFNSDEGANVPKRDFTGLDCTGWDYDLHRPNEPYTARGVHPSGVGINRYRKFSDLNSGEQDYLKLQTWLSILNFADPNLFGFRSFKGSTLLGERPFTWNMTLRHELTSFGHTINANFFLKTGDVNVLVILRRYFNGSRDYPGLDLDLLRYPLRDQNLRVSLILSGWIQPDGQLFTTSAAKPGGAAGCTLYYALTPQIEPYLEVMGKSEGWIAGNVYLESNLSLRTGFTYQF